MDSLPPWSLVEEMLRMLVLPAFGSAALVLVIVCLATRSVPLRLAGGAVALAAGLAAGNHFRELLQWWQLDLHRKDPWTLERGWAALLPVTVIALACGLWAAARARKTHPLAGFAIRLFTAAICSWCLSDSLESLSRDRGAFVLLLAGTVLTWEALLFASARCGRGASLLALMIPWGGAAAAVLIYAHSARFSDLAVLMTASACGVGIIAAIWKAEMAPLFAGPAVFFPALMLAGAANTYSEVPLRAFACAGLAPCALWVLLLPWLRRRSPRVLLAVAVLAVLIPCAAGVVMAAQVETLDFDE